MDCVFLPSGPKFIQFNGYPSTQRLINFNAILRRSLKSQVGECEYSTNVLSRVLLGLLSADGCEMTGFK
jgi:hypothetical protein